MKSDAMSLGWFGSRQKVFGVVVVVALILAVMGPARSEESGSGAEGIPVATDDAVLGISVGLGEYGQSGEITRSQLPEGLQGLVTDETIDAANLALFDAARSRWDVEADFVGQIDYQLEFRSNVDFMNRDLGHIASLLEQKPLNMGSVSMGLYMSDEEVAEMERRDALGDHMDAVVELVSGVSQHDRLEGVVPDYGPLFGGIWMDQLDGGRIVLAVTDASAVDVRAVEDLLGGTEHFKIIEQTYSYNETELYRATLEARFDVLGMDREVAAIWTERGRLIEVRVKDPNSLPAEFGRGIPKDAFTVVEGAVVRLASLPSYTHSLDDQQPGLDIHIYDETTHLGLPCTWAFNGHTNSQHYLVTAGHCMPAGYKNYSGGWVGAVIEVYQNGSTARNLTPGDTFLRSLDTSTYDAARLESSYADDNCYHGNYAQYGNGAHCQWPMANRASDGSWEEGVDRTCASLGKSNTYKCGYITDENAGGGTRVKVAMTIQDGDSGSGMKWDYRIDGVVTDRGEVTDAFFLSGYDAQIALGNGYFYFNCYSPGSIVRSNPSSWGSCPVVNA